MQNIMTALNSCISTIIKYYLTSHSEYFIKVINYIVYLFKSIIS